VGTSGKVIGLDFTQQMVDKANENNRKIGYDNVEFHLGEIENMPLENDIADVIVSNCVLNLVPNKQKAFAEMYRITKPGGHFCVSDIVLKGKLPEGLEKSAAMYAGCVAGAVQQEEYIRLIEQAGFTNVEIKKTKVINLPENVLREYLSDDELQIFHDNKIGIFSITVVGYKN
ncbi:MAG: methyltransferase domain-containing protein, partial [Ignavibacteria bacterium]